MCSTAEEPSIAAARRDVPTVTPAGKLLAKSIDGVRTSSPVNHVDHRGRVFEIYGGEQSLWEKPVVYCYAFTLRPHLTKGWGLHEHKDDRYTLLAGEVLTLLYDARMGSATRGMVQKVILTPEGVRQVLIPAGVWHLSICLSTTEAFLINHPTEVYRHEAPDRLLLPVDSPEIPVDVRAHFPTQYA